MTNKKKWFYVDINTRCHMRIAVRAYNADSARGYAMDIVEDGKILPTEVSDYPYGGSDNSFVVGDVEKDGGIPSGMYKFDVPTGPLAFQ